MLIDHLQRKLHADAALMLRRRRRMADPQQTSVLNFCSNDYLGLARHPALIAALDEGAHLYGVGSGAAALVCGHFPAHQALEDLLAVWMQAFIPAAQVLSFTSGYAANLALMTVLGDASATLFCDKLNHASLIDGALLSRAVVRRYAHANLAVLERELERCATPIRIIVTDAVFSMDGDLADLRAILALAERFDAWIVVDDAHGFGVLGEGGRGSLEYWGLCSERFILMGTLGKAAGLAGAFVAAHPVVIDALMQMGRSYIYTTSAPPAIAHALLTSLALIGGIEGRTRRRRLVELAALFRGDLEDLIASDAPRGWRVPLSATAIQPLIVGDNSAALALAANLDSRGLHVAAIRPPTVPAGAARLRVTLSAVHSNADIRCLTRGLKEEARAWI